MLSEESGSMELRKETESEVLDADDEDKSVAKNRMGRSLLWL
jgi:hypothetical protein